MTSGEADPHPDPRRQELLLVRQLTSERRRHTENNLFKRGSHAKRRRPGAIEGGRRQNARGDRLWGQAPGGLCQQGEETLPMEGYPYYASDSPGCKGDRLGNPRVSSLAAPVGSLLRDLIPTRQE